MGLFDFIEQQNAMRMLIYAIREQPALVEADISRRRTDQARHGMPLHIFGHIETQHLDAEHGCKLARDLRFSNTCRARKKIAADRFFRLPQPRAGQLDGRRQSADSRVLSENHSFQFGVEIFELLRIALRHGLGRNTRHRRHNRFDFGHADGLLATRFRQQHLGSARLVDNIDGLVRQLPVVHVFRRQVHRSFHRVVGIANFVEFLEIGFQPFQDLDRVGHRRFGHVDLLKTPDKCAVLLEVLTILLIRRRSDAPYRAARQSRLQQVRRIHCAAARRTCADDRMNLVDKHDRAGISLDLLDDRLDAFFKIAAIARPRQQGSHVEREYRGIAKNLRHLTLHDTTRQPFRDCGLADARVSHKQRIIL